MFFYKECKRMQRTQRSFYKECKRMRERCILFKRTQKNVVKFSLLFEIAILSWVSWLRNCYVWSLSRHCPFNTTTFKFLKGLAWPPVSQLHWPCKKCRGLELRPFRAISSHLLPGLSEDLKVEFFCLPSQCANTYETQSFAWNFKSLLELF